MGMDESQTDKTLVVKKSEISKTKAVKSGETLKKDGKDSVITEEAAESLEEASKSTAETKADEQLVPKNVSKLKSVKKSEKDKQVKVTEISETKDEVVDYSKDESNMMDEPQTDQNFVLKKSEISKTQAAKKSEKDTQLEVAESLKTDGKDTEIIKEVAESFKEASISMDKPKTQESIVPKKLDISETKYLKKGDEITQLEISDIDGQEKEIKKQVVVSVKEKSKLTGIPETEADMKNEAAESLEDASISAYKPKTEKSEIVTVEGVEKGKKETSSLARKPKIEENLVPEKSEITAQKTVKKGENDKQLELTDAIKTDRKEKEIKKEVAGSLEEASKLTDKPKIDENLDVAKTEATKLKAVKKGKKDTQLEVTDAIKTDGKEIEIKKEVAKSDEEASKLTHEPKTEENLDLEKTESTKLKAVKKGKKDKQLEPTEAIKT